MQRVSDRLGTIAKDSIPIPPHVSIAEETHTTGNVGINSIRLYLL